MPRSIRFVAKEYWHTPFTSWRLTRALGGRNQKRPWWASCFRDTATDSNRNQKVLSLAVPADSKILFTGSLSSIAHRLFPELHNYAETEERRAMAETESNDQRRAE